MLSGPVPSPALEKPSQGRAIRSNGAMGNCRACKRMPVASKVAPASAQALAFPTAP